MTKTIEYMKILAIAALAISIGFAGPAIAQTAIIQSDFYVVTIPNIPAIPNGGITTQQIKCDANDALIQGSFRISKRTTQDQTPDTALLAERFNTTPQNVTRTYEVTIRNFGPDFVDLRLKALCLDMQ